MKRGKLIACIAIVFILCFSIALVPDVLARQKVVGVSNLWLGNEWNQRCHKVICDYLRSKGHKVISTNAQGRTSQQKADVENFISMKVDGIVIKGGEGDAFLDVSKKAWDANIPIVDVIMMLPYAVHHSVDDSWQGTTNLAIWMVNQMHGSGKYIALHAAGWHTLEVRKRMLEEVFSWFPNIKRIGDYHEVDPADPVNRAYQITKASLRAHPDLKGVVTTWGLPAVGAIKAIMEMKKEKQVCVVSIDQERSLLALMHKPNCPPTAVVGIEPDLQGLLAAKAMDAALKYKTVQEARAHIPAVSLTPCSYVATTGIDEFKRKVIYKTIDEAWEGNFGKGAKKPW
ncbi:MAG: sugar ABC transporter substrate-binding protein [Deltaproteobacteria bacterium]|nr:sugar ABC transporter substrate-binding protein [Deltaproteobacteria bacterium]MBW1931054.1 sugar ABC transporter substrate-binding protein [Deltaproteobacteria bacterium]MBW2025123.1 sugar ABC transporter substrate-binding protein [Deltaproteobacteria bacterium]MBW2125079.1 sugar ABC transporter substrate-binding protein [Deltaproteobacteria bacterium]